MSIEDLCTSQYACEAWILTKDSERKHYRKIIRIGWFQKVTKEELYTNYCQKKSTPGNDAEEIATSQL